MEPLSRLRTTRRRRETTARRAVRLGIEGLEVRITPTVQTWTGAVDSLWSTNGNWDTNTAPVGGDDLVFPSGAANLSNTNDIAAGTSFDAISFEASGYDIGGNAITLTNGITSTYSDSGTSTLGLDIALTADETIDVADGGTLDLSGAISGLGYGVNKTGGGTLEFTGGSANTYNNPTNVNAGTLVLGKTDGVISANGSVIVGDNTTAATLQLAGTDQFWVGSDVTVNQGSIFDVSTYQAHISNLNLQGSTVQIDTGGVLDLFVGINTFATTNDVTSSIEGLGTLDIDNTFNMFTIADDADLDVELRISTVLQGTNTGASFYKEGAGTLALSGDNTYDGTTTVDAGVLLIESDNALGATAGGTTVASGAELDLTGNITITGEILSLTGSGILGVGALVSPSDGESNTYDGTISFTADSTIGVGTGSQLTITGQITDGPNNFGLTKTGDGTLTLPNANVHGGGTVINAGVVQISNGGALGTGNVVVASGAELDLVGGLAIGGAALSISGTGTGTAGALRNLSGTSSWAGDVTLGANSTIGVDAGQLTLNGALNGAFNLEKVGASTLVLNHNSIPTFSGDTTISEGTLKVTNSGGLGNSATNQVVADGAALAISGTINVRTNSLTIQGSGVGGTGALVSSGAEVFQTPMTLVADTTVGVTDTVLLLYSQIDNGNNGYSLTKVGAGRLNLEGNPGSFDGSLIDNAGNLRINAYFVGIAVQVNSGATLSGTGQVGAVTSASGATVSPGQTAPGILNADSVNLGSGSTLFIQLNGTTAGTQYSQLTSGIGGSVSLNNPALSVTLGFAPSAGDTFLILDNSDPLSTTGTFNGLPDGSTFTVGLQPFRINYVSGDVVLTAMGLSTTTAVASANPSVFGEAVTFSATISGTGVTPTGTVTLNIDSTDVETVSLSGGSASFTPISDLALGSHVVLVSYSGDSTYTSSSGSLLGGQVVNQADTTTTLTAAPDPSVFGQTVTLTATVTAVAPGAGTPTGTVDFFDGATLLGSGSLSGGVATLTTSSLGVGSHSLTAFFNGDANFNGGSGGISTTVNQADTVTILTAAPDPSVFGQSVTLTATIAAVAPGSGMPTGTVDFFDGATLLGSTSLVGGVASVTTSSLSVGSHSLTAVFNGDTNFNGSTSPLDTTTVNQADTTTTIVATTNPSVFGQPVTFTATVSPVGPSSGTPTGTVTFLINAVPTTVPLVGGVASVTSSNLVLGSQPIIATYSSDSSFTASTGTVLQSVLQGSTTTTVSASVASAVLGQPVTFTATVSPQYLGTPNGTVLFSDNGNPIGGPVTLDGSGQATITTSTMITGNHTITAVYMGGLAFLPSTGSYAPDPFVVGSAATTTQVASDDATSLYGQPVIFTALVAVDAPGSGTPTGSVEYFDGSSSLGTATVNGLGIAALSVSTLTVSASPHSITAVFTPADGAYATSTSASPANQVVERSSLSATVMSSASTSPVGQSVTLTAHLTANAPGGGTPTGLVYFMDNYRVIGTAPLVNGVASLSTNDLRVGSNLITTYYAGDANFTTISSQPNVFVQVNRTTSTLTVSSSDAQSDYGQAVTFTATIATDFGTPTGTVTFVNTRTNTVLAVVPVSGSKAHFTTSSLDIGTRFIAAGYSGDANHIGSSNAVVQQTAAASTATIVVSSANPAVFGQSVTYTATVHAVAPGAGTPTGGIAFYDGLTLIGVAPLSNGQAAITLPATGAGQAHAIAALYVGSHDFTASASPTISQVVTPANSETRLTSTPVVTNGSRQVQLTAGVSALAPGAGTPTGVVTFFVDGQAFRQATLSGGTATIVVPSSVVTGRSVSVAYNGDTNFRSSRTSSLVLNSTAFRAANRPFHGF